MKTYYIYETAKKSKRRLSIAAFISENQLCIGVAQCSKKDQFNKKIGRAIAEGRALKHPTIKVQLEKPIIDAKELIQLIRKTVNKEIQLVNK
jgi:hypothetical protein